MERSIIEAAPIAMVMVDGAGRIVLVNSLVERTFGYGRAELLGQPVEVLLPERYRAGHVGDRREYTAGPEPRAMGRGRDLFCRRKDGTEFPAEIGLNPVETATGRYVLSSIVDMTERKRQETLLREAKDRAEQATEVKSAFLASMSHEIRTPLHGVLGMARILLETELSEEQREFADLIRRSGERLLGIINDILDLSKIEAGRVTVEEAEFDLEAMLTEVAATLRPRAAEKGLSLLVRYPARAPRRVRGDAQKLQQIVMNLAGNAIKFTERGHVLIHVARRGAWWRIRVEDTGIGIPREALGRIFESFSQADEAVGRRFGGTGLGLSISREFAALLGGRVKVHSRVGEGSCFRLLARLEAGAGPGNRPADLRGLRVGLRLGGGILEGILREQVEECGGSVVEAGADVVLADAGEWTGPAGERVVAVAVRPKAGEAARLAGMGAEGYLVHPVTAAELGRILLEGRGRESGPRAVAALAGEPRVLLVEDERVNQQVSRRMLERLGCVVDVASSGAEAIRLADRGRYDAILMDWHMPGMDGLETTAALRERERARGARPTAIIAQTASAMAGDRERCIGEGMDDFLSKPLSLEALRAVLERWAMVSLATGRIGH